MIAIDIKSILYKLHRHFKLFTTRHPTQDTLEENVCLSLSAAVDRFIEMFMPLKDHFHSIGTLQRHKFSIMFNGFLNK